MILYTFIYCHCSCQNKCPKTHLGCWTYLVGFGRCRTPYVLLSLPASQPGRTESSGTTWNNDIVQAFPNQALVMSLARSFRFWLQISKEHLALQWLPFNMLPSFWCQNPRCSMSRRYATTHYTTVAVNHGELDYRVIMSDPCVVEYASVWFNLQYLFWHMLAVYQFIWDASSATGVRGCELVWDM